LHPTQRRILTVREFARAQGFFDTFTWDIKTQPPQAMYKQIGNAVSLQLGRALGKELFNVLYAQWESEKAMAIEEKLQTVEFDDHDEFDAEGFEEFEDDEKAMPIQEKLQTVEFVDQDGVEEEEFEEFEDDDIEMQDAPSGIGLAYDEPIVISDSE
jgi:hypothetical protein